MVNDAFERWAQEYSGCDGGDPRGVWICGIEWGRGESEGTLDFNEDVSAPKHLGQDGGWRQDLVDDFHKGPYNRSLLKLLTAMDGHFDKWQDFYRAARPFHHNTGYFRANLFPIAFRGTSSTHWQSQVAHLTGFETKDDYLHWCRRFRFAAIQKWMSDYRPPLVICTGITFKDDFLRAFGVADLPVETEEIQGKPIFYVKGTHGWPTVVITYFLGGRHGLNSNVKLMETGRRLAQLLRERC